jgi:hypothetical protein
LLLKRIKWKEFSLAQKCDKKVPVPLDHYNISKMERWIFAEGWGYGYGYG